MAVPHVIVGGFVAQRGAGGKGLGDNLPPRVHAAAMLRRALLLLPASAAAQDGGHRARAERLRALDEFRAALGEYDAALRAAPGDATLLAERALTLHRLGEVAAAGQGIAAAVAAAGPRESGPHAARAGLALLARRDAEAAADLAEALRRDPSDRRAQGLVALLRARRGEAPTPDDATLEILRHAFGPWLAP
jgi:tetratricopeptide (TPR) repeat protein